ncbi:MAG TPA: hypothetical protein VD906_13480 [Caulobacteraceae bacterium]|nr:hypothetical protein [Caulobacteraceae bacterium]
MAALLRSSLLHMAFGFVLMGAWALWANWSHGPAEAWPSALAQGTASALLTALIKKTLEGFAGRLTGLAAYAVPPFVTAACVLIMLGAVHTLVGTPEIVRTIAFPWTFSTLYAVIYNAGLVRAR